MTSNQTENIQIKALGQQVTLFREWIQTETSQCISASQQWSGPVTSSQLRSIRAKYWKTCTFILADQKQKRQEKHKTR